MSTSENLYVVFTMDCERIRKYSPPGGPETWELSEKAIKGYTSVLTDYGYTGTLFIVPNTAEYHRDLFLELKDEGFELGMHYHPQSFLDGRYTKYLGEYSYSEQLEQLSLAVDYWSRALGFKPESFRPGNFSANKYTYSVLVKLGFRQGSDYLPNRNIPKYHAVWINANPYPHHVKEGDYLEVPTTAAIWEPIKKGDPTHLRIEGYSAEKLCCLVDQWVKHLIEKNIVVKTIVVLTHNFIDYTDSGNKHRVKIEKLIKCIEKTARENNLSLVPITLEKLHRILDNIK
ncbi:MAG: hypothetical protein DRJ63_06760 [Thermoprotei archaeon]|nr:MAG: hypothetical protein DRJ63_06760 [Thermoprotei archaeon]